MAIKQLSKTSGNYVDVMALAPGTVIEGNLLGFKDRAAKTADGREFVSRDLILKTPEGKELSITGKSKVRYFESDFIKPGDVKLGDYLILTSYSAMSKKGKAVAGFNVAVDDERGIEVKPETKNDF